MQAQLEQTSSATANADIFLVTTSNGSVRQVFPLAEQLIGLPAEVILGINAFTFFHVDDVPMIMSIISETMTRGRESRAVELRIRREGDSWRAVTLSASRDQPDSDTLGIAFRLRGPDTSVQAADQIARLALHDRVTDLPNRALFVDRIDHACVRAARRSQPVVVLVVGFNGYGLAGEREAIDEDLVIAVARRLRSCLRASDSVARLSHDEYGILLEDVSTDHGIASVV
ncbi:MAG TPA: diguanylate cyclase, partial [Thermomicrobiales bacterium]|nr:diguanylate cyclase [Thermomicrobiales bacterium]